MPAPIDVASAASCLPVSLLPQDDPDGQKTSASIALCLSGGGYRAMVFHLGALLRLNEAGIMKKLDRVSSVSGGSISTDMLGLKWSRLRFDEKGVTTNLTDESTP